MYQQEKYGGFQWCGGGRMKTVMQRKQNRPLSKDLAGQSAKVLEYPLHVTGVVVFDDRSVPDINLFDPSRP